MATLIINDTKQFDQQVWQTETDFTQEQYNEWLNTASKKVQQLYDELDTDINEGMSDIPSDRLYILGDIINLLNNTEIEVKKELHDEYKHSYLVEFIKDNCHLKSWQIEQAWDYIGNKYPIPHEVSDKIDVAITEFCIENDIDNDLVLSWEDNDDLFMECFTNNE